MDPIAHSFTGAALAASGLRRVTPLATAALIVGANVPDVDVFTGFAGRFTALELRRGWTHGLLAVAVWPFIVTGLLLLWERSNHHRRALEARARPGPLLGIAALAVLTHPTLDWLNNYGMRWLMPFDGRWFYGDALFIIDPWLWLLFGGVLFLQHSRRGLPLGVWLVFWVASTWLVLSNVLPLAAQVAWCAGLLAVLLARWRGLGGEHLARGALAVVAVYMLAESLANLPAQAAVRARLAETGFGPIEDLMVAPVPGDPFAGAVVVETAADYWVGRWHWLTEPRFELTAERIDKRVGDPIVAAASAATEAHQFLVWSRYPYFEVESSAAGHVVHLRDARYAENARLFGPTVRLDRELKIIGHEPASLTRGGSQ